MSPSLTLSPLPPFRAASSASSWRTRRRPGARAGRNGPECRAGRLDESRTYLLQRRWQGDGRSSPRFAFSRQMVQRGGADVACDGLASNRLLFLLSTLLKHGPAALGLAER